METPEPEPRNRPFRRLAPTLRTAVAIFLSLLCTVLDRARALAEEAKPARVVSINMCTDELLLRLADRDRIASVTWLSRDGRNANMAEVAATTPAYHGLAEEVVSYHPDLVLAGVYTTRTTVQLLKGIGLKVVEFGVPKTLDGVRQQIRDVAAAVGEGARGEAVVAEMDARLDRLAPHAHNPPLNAIVLRPNGFTVGKGSLVNELLERAGLVNLAFGAVVAFYSGLSGAFSLALPLGGIAGAILAAVVLYGLVGRGAGTMTLILAGVAINSFAGAVTSLALNLSPNPYAALEIIFWLMGSLVDRSLPQVWLVLPLMIVGWALLASSASALDSLTLGEDGAQSLGFDLRALRLKLIAGSALAVGSAVAVTGAIGFVGLVVPHILRPFVGARPGRLLLVSGFGGAILLLAADIVVRLLPIHPELKLGVITAIIGAPFLFSLIYRLRQEA